MLSSSAPRRELTFAAPLTTADGIAAVDEASAGGVRRVTARRAMVLGVALSSRPPPQLQQPKPPPPPLEGAPACVVALRAGSWPWLMVSRALAAQIARG